MIVPFEPEPIEEACERFPVALETTYEAWRSDLPGWNRPGQKRENIFDFEDGLRLMVSRDVLHAGGEPVIHVSASLHEEEAVESGWDRLSKKRFERGVRQRLETLTGGRVRVGSMWLTCGGIPHWTIWMEDAQWKRE